MIRRAGMRCQPRLEAGGVPVRQQVDHVPGAHVHQHRPVYLALGQREVIDPEHLRRGGDLRLRRRCDQPQHRRGMHGDPQRPGQPGSGAPGQLQPEPGQHPQQRHAAPPVTGRHAPGLLSEGDRRAGRVPAAEPAHLQDDQHRPATHRAVRHHPRVPAVHPRRLLTAPRAARPPGRHDAEITTACPMSSTRCTHSPARCGNNAVSRLPPGPETSQAGRGALAAPAGGMTD